MSQMAASALLVALFLLALFGTINEWLQRTRDTSSKQVVVEDLVPKRDVNNNKMLFVLMHGFKGDSRRVRKHWDAMANKLSKHGDVLKLRYPAGLFSNTDPLRVSDEVGGIISRRALNYEKVVLIGHSIGALIARRAFLDEAKNSTGNWANPDTRIVLLAGMNRGWDVSGQKPKDMHWYNRLAYWWGSWFGRLTATSKFVLSAETGAPFVENLRLDWIRFSNEWPDKTPEVVQLLGDIDDIVGESDNQDLRAAVNPKFVWLRVRGTNHSNIINLNDQNPLNDTGRTFGDYRWDKLLLAATAGWKYLSNLNEDAPYETDKQVTHIVFVLHGIRDLGEWAARFEEELQQRFQKKHAKEKENKKLVIVSVRYGYFGMGQFLLNSSRGKYVRWFMDQYTETLARYPKAQRVDFVGHSNGTYLLASALKKYSSVKVDHIIFAGSVVPKEYRWGELLGDDRIKSVRNYVAYDDWVVALFPRLFESWPVSVISDELGSAGFNGFTWKNAEQDQVGKLKPLFNINYVSGGHSAFQKHAGPISDYLISNGNWELEGDSDRRGGWTMLKWVSDWIAWGAWILIAILVLSIGSRIMEAAGQPGWPVFALYLIAVLLVLRWV